MPPLRVRSLALATAVLLGALGPAAALAATPKDMVVMAAQLDEFITLDPAEIYELVPTEYAANVYDRLVTIDPADPSQIVGSIAESWTVSADGKTFTFKIRQGLEFHSGNLLSAEDVAWSLQRVIKLNKGPAFILAEFGLTPENVEQRVKAVDANTVTLETAKVYSPSFVLNCLASWVSSVVDKKLLLANEKDGDLGNGWLKTHEAGSGPFKLVAWKAGESVIVERNDAYWGKQPAIKRVVLRHVPEAASQRLLIEKGDVDIARNLGPDDLKALAGNADIRIRSVPQSAIYYMGLNTRNPNLGKPEVQEAMKWLVDYRGIADNILKGTYEVHQAFLPKGFLGAIDEQPYRLDVDKARALLEKAGLKDGFSVTIDVRNAYPSPEIAQALQANMAKAGIKLEIIPGDNKQTLTKYRSRTHDIYLGQWAPDYMDPHSNAQGFAWNPDNSDSSKFKLLAWRNSWDIPKLTQESEAALAEQDTAKRTALYQSMQREFQKNSPFVIMFQRVQPLAERKGVAGFVFGPINDMVYYSGITKQ